MTKFEYQRAQVTIRLLNTLNRCLGWIAGAVIIGSTLFYLGIGFFSVIAALEGEITQKQGLLMVLCVLTFILGLFIAGLSYLSGAAARKLVFYANRHYRPAKIPLEPVEKEPDFNKDVLHHFFNGPELRDPDDDQFTKGFKDR